MNYLSRCSSKLSCISPNDWAFVSGTNIRAKKNPRKQKIANIKNPPYMSHSSMTYGNPSETKNPNILLYANVTDAAWPLMFIGNNSLVNIYGIGCTPITRKILKKNTPDNGIQLSDVMSCFTMFCR